MIEKNHHHGEKKWRTVDGEKWETRQQGQVPDLGHQTPHYQTCGKVFKNEEANVNCYHCQNHPPYHLQNVKITIIIITTFIFLFTFAVMTVNSSTSSAK